MGTRLDLVRLIRGMGAVTLALGAFACCPTVSGPTAPAASGTARLEPGERMVLDAETPADTTQVDVTFRLDSESLPLRVRQIDPGCTTVPLEACASYTDTTLTPRPAGVLQFSMVMQPHGARTRVVVENPSADSSILVTLTVQPRRAGCT